LEIAVNWKRRGIGRMEKERNTTIMADFEVGC